MAIAVMVMAISDNGDNCHGNGYTVSDNGDSCHGNGYK